MRVVVANTRAINDSIEDIKPVPDGTYSPKIEGADGSFHRNVLCKCEEDLW